MNDFGALVARQLRADLRELPRRAQAWVSAEGWGARAVRVGSIGELRAAARHALPRVVFDFMEGAAEDELTAARNVSELRATELQPRVLVDVSTVRTATTVLGQPVTLPLLGAPMGLTAQSWIRLCNRLRAGGVDGRGGRRVAGRRAGGGGEWRVGRRMAGRRAGGEWQWRAARRMARRRRVAGNGSRP